MNTSAASIHRPFATAILCACALALAACVTGGATTGARADRNVLLGSELRQQHYNSVYEAVESLRGNWLQSRGPDSFQSPSQVLVYLDNVKVGGIEMLRTLDISVVGTIQHFDGTEATARWGVGHGAGVIQIISATAAAKDPLVEELNVVMVSQGRPSRRALRTPLATTSFASSICTSTSPVTHPATSSTTSSPCTRRATCRWTPISSPPARSGSRAASRGAAARGTVGAVTRHRDYRQSEGT